MKDNKELERKLIDLKTKVMLQKIDKLYLICSMLLAGSESGETKYLEIIKKRYLQMCSNLNETGEYEKYKNIEDIIIKEIAMVELNVNQYIYNTFQNYERIIKNIIDSIYKSENYQNFNDLEQEIQHVETLKQILKLYSPYINENEIKRLDNDISVLKFNALWRNQVQKLIHWNAEKECVLIKYDSPKERKCFVEQLHKKMKSLRVMQPQDIENDEILDIKPDAILEDNNLLERLIIVDMVSNPYEYINLVKAKVFNAHLCNLDNNPFEQEVYLTEKQLNQLGYYGHLKFGRKEEVALKANKVNYSLLRAILKGIITDENISIIECNNLYKKFGFKCRPILVTDGQKLVKIIYDTVKKSKEYEKTITESRKSKEGKYCKIDFEGLIYDFDVDLKGQISDDVHEYENSVRDLLNQRKVARSKKRKIHIKKEQIHNEEDQQTKKQKVKEAGIITKDIDIIVLLIQDIITNNSDKIRELREEFNVWSDEIEISKYEIQRYEEKIKSEESRIKELKQLKSKDGKLTLEETKKLLLTINDIYRKLHIRYDVWKLLPLEDMWSENSNKVYLAPIPEESGTERVEVRHSFPYGSEYEDRYYYKSNLRPLWEKYQGEFKDLGIDVRKYSRYYESKPQFEICINLDDISDLPIDYEKLKILTKEELQEIIEREEGNER